MLGLTPSKENYLKTISALTRGCENTCVTDIAAQMQITKASVSRTVTELEALGLVRRFKGRRVGLTEEGKRQAGVVLSRFDVISAFFCRVLNISKETSVQEACKLEHLLSDASLEAMQNLLQNT